MKLRHYSVLGLLLLAVGCSSGDSDRGGTGQVGAGVYKLGRPYVINGRQYVPEYDPSYSKVGTASWYGDYFHGRSTANGEIFDKDLISAAHPTLPLPSLVRVTNLENDRVLVLRVNDRGPFVGDRLIDLSQAAARELGYEQEGLARVKVEFVQLADARGTPPVPTRAASAASSEPHPYQGFTGERIQVAKLEPASPEPAPRSPTQTDALPVAACALGPQWVQVGAFREADRVRVATSELRALQDVKIEPVMINGSAAMRVKLGPMADRATATSVLAEVRRLGYAGAFLAPVDATSRMKRC